MISKTPSSWQIIPCEDTAAFKSVRVRDDARVRAVVRHLLADECVALLGPPMSEKSHLLGDVAAALAETGRFQPLLLDLWRTRSDDETTFFASLIGLIRQALGPAAPPAPREAASAHGLQRYLLACANRGTGAEAAHLALLIDHLQALPHDLVHGLLLALRAAYMEREADGPRRLVAVVTGGMNLAGLSAGPTSPFNIARPVVTQPLTPEQSRALAEATLASHGCHVSPPGLERIVAWAGGDRFLLPQLCAWAAEWVRPHRRPTVTCAVVERVAEQFWTADPGLPPIREAVRVIEEDPDTMLDVLHILDHGALARARSRQSPTRTGADRLQLSGAVALTDGCYTLLNGAYRRALAEHFSTERVGHVLRIAGRWGEAIEYLAPRLAVAQGAGSAEARRSRGAGEKRSVGAEELGDEGPVTDHGSRITNHVARSPQYAAHPQLLEAIVQSIYATDAPERAYDLLATALRHGFGLAEVTIYRAAPARGQLEQVYPRPERPVAVDLHDPECVEARTFHYGSYALRGTADEARLIVTLASADRPIGILAVEHFARQRDPHLLPDELPDLLHFLHHAANALENVLIRAAYRAIGQAVLDARALQPTVERVLEAVSDALGCDYAALYLLDEGQRQLVMTAGVGRPVTPEWLAQARLPLTGRHPAATCLAEGRLLTVRRTEDRQDAALVERFGLHKYARSFLPLAAAGEKLGVLELGYAGSARQRPGEEQRRTLAAFADQVAIAVHNMQLLRRTDQALARRNAEIAVGREIQLSLLPTELPQAPGWEFAAVYQAARTVGGDFYDFYELPGAPRRLGIVIADVADKGVPAALFMAVSRTLIRTIALSGRSPAATLRRANDLLLRDSRSDLFLSAVYVLLEPETGRLVYANAGHNRPLWYHAADRTLTELDQRGIVLGAFDEITLGEEAVALAPGDLLLLYTDGLTDALNADGEMFGEERLRTLVAAHAAASAQELLWAITGAVAGFIGGAEQADDVTGVVVRWG